MQFTSVHTQSIIIELLTGTTKETLLARFPHQEVSTLLERLANEGVLCDGEVSTHVPVLHEYQDLLERHVVGPGRIVREVKKVEAPDHYGLSVYCGLGFSPRLIQDQSSINVGWGADPDPSLAGCKAIMETVERYELAEYSLEGMLHAPWAEVQSLTPSPRQLGTTESALISAGSIHWKLLTGLTAEQACLAPIDALYHPIDYTELGRMPCAPLNISGVAAHQSTDAALTNALLELCEHEALMCAWHSGVPCPTITQESIDEQSRQQIKLLELSGWEIVLKDVSQDLVPVVMAIARGPIGRRALIIGSCAAFTLRYAVKKALSEVLRTILVDEALPAPSYKTTREDVQDVLGHGYYYAQHEHLSEADHLWCVAEMIEATDMLSDGSGRTLQQAQAEWGGDEVRYEKEYLLNIFRQRAIATYWADYTPKLVLDTNVALRVVRAFGPEMARMTVGYDTQPAMTERFKYLLARARSAGVAQKVGPLHPFS
jgi:thiazole/oxazole-forming peptide maturase SagD family component